MEMEYLRCVFCLLVATFLLQGAESAEVNLDTKLGSVVGISGEVEFMGERKYVTRFLGIPYAKPPIGARRFLRPEPFGTYSQTYNATYFRSHCMQSEYANPAIRYFKMSEDCLHLNIFTPGSTVSATSKYAVIIFIHGGSFITDGAEMFSGDKLSPFNDVVLVTISYRLNSFGFISNGTKSSGNMGLWDQKMAIQWVHDNIEDFAGDPEKVTVIGNSAGGASVLYQALNPSNRGLFQRIVTQSGSVLAQWAQQYNPAGQFLEFVSKMNCSSGQYSDILRCLQSLPAEVLVTSHFRPVVDWDFIQNDPKVIFADDKVDSSSPLGLFMEMDYLCGVTSKDGANIVTRSLHATGIALNKGVPRNIFESYIFNNILQIYGKNMSEALVQSIKYQYTDWSRPNDHDTNRDKMVDFMSDIHFFEPALNAIKKHNALKVASGRTYFYVFDHKPFFDLEPEWLEGAKHTMEIPYVFGFPDAMKVAAGFPPDMLFTVPQKEQTLSSVVMKMWTNFAKTGDPNSPVPIDVQGVPAWPTYDLTNQSYLELSTAMTSDSVKSHFAEPRMEFWTNIVPLLESCGTCEGCLKDHSDSKTSSGNSYKIDSLFGLVLVLFTAALLP